MLNEAAQLKEFHFCWEHCMLLLHLKNLMSWNNQSTYKQRLIASQTLSATKCPPLHRRQLMRIEEGKIATEQN